MVWYMTTPLHSIQWSPTLSGTAPAQPLQGPHVGRPAGEDRSATAPARGSQPEVLADISPLAVYLVESGFDAHVSRVERVLERREFQLKVASSATEKLTASGYYSERTRSLDLAYRYTVQQEVAVDGVVRVRTFEVELNISISQVSRRTASPFMPEDDILSLARGLMKDISRIMTGDGSDLRKLVLSHRDLMDLQGRKHGGLVDRLMQLINLTIMLARLKHLLESDEPQEGPARGDVA